MIAAARDVARAVGILVLVRDVVNKRAFRQREPRIVLREHLAEVFHGGKHLIRREFLVAHRQHGMLDEGFIERRARIRLQRNGTSRRRVSRRRCVRKAARFRRSCVWSSGPELAFILNPRSDPHQIPGSCRPDRVDYAGNRRLLPGVRRRRDGSAVEMPRGMAENRQDYEEPDETGQQ